MNPVTLFGVHTYNYVTSTSDSSGSGWLLFTIPLALITLCLFIFEIVAYWRVNEKAGKPGWACLIPLYNTWVLAEIAGKPGWWGLFPLLAVVPVVGAVAALVVYVLLCTRVARNFGKTDTSGILGLWLFGFIGFPILAFGPAKYKPVE